MDRPSGIFNTQVGGILFGDMAVVMKALANETGTNPGFYDAAWHVLYPR